jgi:hypothetical protein
MENWERKFNVDPEGKAEEAELSEEEKMKQFAAMHPQKKKLIRLGDADKKTFVADEKGNVEVVQDKDREEGK